MATVQEAKFFAIGRHGKQLRKYTNDPYWYHLKHVVDILNAAKENNPITLQAAWLHDVVEDTDTEIEEIKSLFGHEVSDTVFDLTDTRFSEGNRAARKKAYADSLAKTDYVTQSIKLADLISNTSSIVQYDPKFAKVFLEEKKYLLSVMTGGSAILRTKALEILQDSLNN